MVLEQSAAFDGMGTSKLVLHSPVTVMFHRNRAQSKGGGLFILNNSNINTV